jgi:hypothetical protein
VPVPGVLSFAVAILAIAASVPPPPPALPETGWPTPAVAASYARDLVAKVPAEDFDEYLDEHPDAIPAAFRNIGSALMTGDADLRLRLERYLGVLTRRHATHATDIRVLVSLQLVDPIRFLEDDAFRARVLPLLPRALDSATKLSVREACLRELNDAIGLDFDQAETVARAWNVIPRTSASRRVAFNDSMRMPDDLSGPIEASIFSINSRFFTADEANAFVAAVRKAAPKRKILVLADAPIKDALKNVDVIETFSRPYTPWPRDPFIVGHAKRGIVFVNRPNLQPEREEDANMVRALVQSGDVDARWTVAPVPFHNGHVLLTPDTAWISIHTVEIRALQILGLERVPVETFTDPRGISAYITAVMKAAKELEALYGRPVKFVHPLDADPELFRLLGGGGGFDLDSIVTLLPQKSGSLVAVVGDIEMGAELARVANWSEAARAYGIKQSGSGVAVAQASAGPAALGAFLDVVAASLQMRGVEVLRIPLISIPHEPADFLLTWNNVVLEKAGTARRAEGFASLLTEGDTIARQAFAKAGYDLTLFPPLARSVVLSGGYRCASNHVRP